MKRLPFFIEVWESSNNAEVRLCHKVMAHLFKQKITPLPFATTAREVADVLLALKKQGLVPSLFVVNTFWAEQILPMLDPLIGETPTLFFRREICSQDVLGGDAARGMTTVAIRNMTPRECSIWAYGSKTSDAVAERAAQAVVKYLQDGVFQTIERSNPSLRPVSGQFILPRKAFA